MKRGINKITLLGTVGSIEFKITPTTQTPICNISLATNDEWKDRLTGEIRKSTEWHNLVVFGNTAEMANKHILKGQDLYIEGSIKTEKWDDKKTGEKREKKIINVKEIRFAGTKPGDGENRVPQQASQDFQQPQQSGGQQGYQNNPDTRGQANRGNDDQPFSDEIPF